MRWTLGVVLVAAACAAPASAPTTLPPAANCPAPPTDVAVIDEHDLVERLCATIGERATPEARIEVLRLDPRTISVFWTGGCDLSTLVVAPIDGGHRFTAYPAERDCAQAAGYPRSITLVTRRPLGTVEYLMNTA